MHPELKKSLILGGVILLISGGLLAWRFGWVPQIGKFFAAETTMHRIGIRQTNGIGEFYDTITGQKFIPRGNNYIRLDGGHSTFNPGKYDSAKVESALAQMEYDGYNIIRVFFDHIAIVGNLTTPGVDPVYMANVVDFLRRAQAHKIYVYLSASWVPTNYGSIASAIPAPANVRGENSIIMSQGYINANGAFWKDIINTIKSADVNLLSTVFGYDVWNEVAFYSDKPPFSLSSGSVTPAEGGTYDMANTQSRQLVADNSATYWANQLTLAIKSVDTLALVTTSQFSPVDVQRTGYDGVRPVAEGADSRAPLRPTALYQSAFDYLDLHAYPQPLHPTGGDKMNSFELFSLGAQKPFIMGEMGAYRTLSFSYPDVISAANALRNHQVASCTYRFQGWLLWTWDTSAEQPELFSALDGGGAINGALAPRNRYDPCVTENTSPPLSLPVVTLNSIPSTLTGQTLGTISGTATDAIGVTKVKVVIRYKPAASGACTADSRDWDGTAWVTGCQVAGQITPAITAGTSVTWSVANTPPLAQMNPGAYRIFAAAYRSETPLVWSTWSTFADTTYQTGSLSAVPGDANGDGKANILDFNIIVSHFGQSGAAVPGDVNHDGKVDILDFGLVVSHFGS